MRNTTSLTTITTALNAVLAVPFGDLERAMQEAHESTSKQTEDPDEVFPVSRQALRMFWHFRCNLDAVQVFMESE